MTTTLKKRIWRGAKKEKMKMNEEIGVLKCLLVALRQERFLGVVEER